MRALLTIALASGLALLAACAGSATPSSPTVPGAPGTSPAPGAPGENGGPAAFDAVAVWRSAVEGDTAPYTSLKERGLDAAFRQIAELQKFRPAGDAPVRAAATLARAHEARGETDAALWWAAWTHDPALAGELLIRAGRSGEALTLLQAALGSGITPATPLETLRDEAVRLARATGSAK